MPNSIDFYKVIFLHVISDRTIVSCVRQGIILYDISVLHYWFNWVCKSPVKLENRFLNNDKAFWITFWRILVVPFHYWRLKKKPENGKNGKNVYYRTALFGNICYYWGNNLRKERGHWFLYFFYKIKLVLQNHHLDRETLNPDPGKALLSNFFL